MSDPLFDLSFSRANAFGLSSGTIKTDVEDFYVEELFEPDLAGEGEHVWIWLEKKGQNTEYVAKALARFAGVRDMDVGFSGQKDRWAHTRQWFSIYLGNRPEPEWSAFDMEQVSILKHVRHQKKLRRGEHFANRFRLIVRELEAAPDLEEALSWIKANGFPNYYGPQRFGKDGANLERGIRYFNREIKASRSQRSFYLSAARSYLFNLNLAKVIEQGVSPNDSGDGPLYGDAQENVQPLSEQEQAIYDTHPELAKGIHGNRMKLERRPYFICPDEMSWVIDANCLELSFNLPKGVFATALLAEFLNFRVALGET